MSALPLPFDADVEPDVKPAKLQPVRSLQPPLGAAAALWMVNRCDDLDLLHRLQAAVAARLAKIGGVK